MRFATLEIGGHPRPVVISGDHQNYCEVGDAVVGFDGDMTDLIARFPSPAAAFAKADRWQPLAGRKVLAPIPPRRNILCVGKNYHEQRKEFAQRLRHSPPGRAGAAKRRSSSPSRRNGGRRRRGDAMRSPALTPQLDYEAELAVIIGKPAAAASPRQTRWTTSGATPSSTTSPRATCSSKHRQWFIGKIAWTRSARWGRGR